MNPVVTVIPHAPAHQLTEPRPCRFCGVAATELVGSDGRMVLFKCRACQLHWLDVETKPDQVDRADGKSTNNA